MDSSVKFLSRLVRTNGFKRCVGIALFEDSEGILVADSRILLVNLLDFLVVSRRCRFEYISRNWRMVAEGTRMTQDFASFLKES